MKILKRYWFILIFIIAIAGCWRVSNDILTGVFATVILCAGLWLFIGFEKNINKTVNNLTRVNHDLSEFKAHFSDYKLNGNQQLVSEFINFLEKEGDLKTHFKHFMASCIQEKTNYFATHKIEDYITTKNVFRIKSFYEDGAGLLTGLGLLFTFIAIAFGLSHLDLASTDTTVIQNGIGQLIGGLSAKFMSSICGIGAALFYSWYRPLTLDQVDKQIYLLNKNINSIFKFKYTEQMLYEIKENAKEQTENLKDFFAGDDFADAIRKIIDGSSDQKVVPILNEIKDTLIRSDTSKTLEAMNLFINSISEKMTEVNSQQADGLVKSIQEVQEQSRQFIQEIAATLMEKSEALTKQFAQQQVEVVAKQSAGQKIIEENINTMITEMSHSSNEVLAKVNDKIISITQALMQTQTDAITNLDKNTKQNQNNINEIQEKFTETMGHFSKYVDRNVATNNQMNELVGNILAKYKEMISANQQQLDKTTSSLSGINQAMGEFKNISGTMTTAATSISSAASSLKNMNNSLDHQAQLLNNGFETLRSSLEQQLGDWGSHIDSTRETEAQVMKLVNTLNSTIESYVVKFDERNTRFIEEFSQQITKIASSTNSAIESIDEFSDRCGDLLTAKR
jgi:hypothetical protein